MTEKVHLPRSMPLGGLVNRIGATREKILELIGDQCADFGLNETNNKAFWRQRVDYKIAKQIAELFGVETIKDIRPEYEKHHLMFPDPLEKYECHDERFSLLDTSLLPIYYFGKSEKVSELDLHKADFYPMHSTGDGDIEQYSRQINDHINHMAGSLNMSPMHYMARLHLGYKYIPSTDSFDLLDAHDIVFYLEQGADYKQWYQEARAFLLTEYGEDEAKLMCLLLAATSINRSLSTNIPAALRARKVIINNQGQFGGLSSSEVPRLELIRAMWKKYQEGEGPLYNPMPTAPGRSKVHDFANALLGDPTAVPKDKRMRRAYRIARSDRQINPHEDRQMEVHVQLMAEHIDRQPREIQAAIWVGIRTGNSSKQTPIWLHEAWK